MDEKVFLRKEKGRLVPAWAHDADLLARVPDGAVVSTTLKRPRRLSAAPLEPSGWPSTAPWRG